MSRDVDLAEKKVVYDIAAHLVEMLVHKSGLHGAQAFSVTMTAAQIIFFGAPPAGREAIIEAARRWLADLEKNIDETRMRERLGLFPDEPPHS